MKWLWAGSVIACISLSFLACHNERKGPSDTVGSGSIDISVDETYRPVIEQQLKVFDSSYPEAHITAHYKPESECLKDLLGEKSRIVLVTRGLSDDEKKYCLQKKIVPTTLILARDAVAVVVNPASSDSILSMAQLRGILTGQYNKKYTVVFDNQGSSTVRYVEDSILKGQKLGANVYAAKGNPAVVDYVAENPNAIGLIGLSYVSDEADEATGSFLKKIKVVSLQNDSTMEFYKPYQAYIALRVYPLARNLFYINRETYPGLGTGFANFLSGERGQLIFHHAHLFPLQTNIVIRDAAISPRAPGQ